MPQAAAMPCKATAAAGGILVAFLAGQPTAVKNLLAAHVDDGRGGCRGCSVGTQGPRLPWPCTLHSAASRAAELLAAPGLPPRHPKAVESAARRRRGGRPGAA